MTVKSFSRALRGHDLWPLLFWLSVVSLFCFFVCVGLPGRLILIPYPSSIYPYIGEVVFLQCLIKHPPQIFERNSKECSWVVGPKR